MKTRFNQLILVFLIAVFSQNSKAQFKDVGNFFAAGVEDAQNLFEPYLSPYINAFGASLTGGWYNTAKVHKPGGFDITATFNIGIVPPEFKTFDISEIDLQSLRLAGGEDPISPTVAGENKSGPQINYHLNGFSAPAFDMPKGTNNPFIPSPMLQLGVGLIKETEVIGRYMPTFSIGDNSVGMWGIGGKHSLKQWIPFMKRIPVLEVSVLYGFTKLSSTIGLEVLPEHINAQDQTTDVDWDDQKMSIIAKSHTANLLVSANLPAVCFYGGVGMATTKSTLKLEGDYPIIDDDQTISEREAVVTDESYSTDPINMEVKNQDGGVTKPRLNLGVRFKFAVVTLHFDYTRANYNVATAGLGISFR